MSVSTSPTALDGFEGFQMFIDYRSLKPRRGIKITISRPTVRQLHQIQYTMHMHTFRGQTLHRGFDNGSGELKGHVRLPC